MDFNIIFYFYLIIKYCSNGISSFSVGWHMSKIILDRILETNLVTDYPQ